MISRFEEITKRQIHHLFKRGLAHYDIFMDKILDSYEKREKFFLYTDFCPIKNSLNLDDVNRLLLVKWLQEVFNVPLIVNVKDNHGLLRGDVLVTSAGDEKEIKKVIADKQSLQQNLNVKQMKALVASVADKQGFVRENHRQSCMELISLACITEMIALGLDPARTFVCRHLEYLGHEQSYVRCIIETGALISLSRARAFYTLDGSDSIQTTALASKDIASLFSASYSHILGCENNIRCFAVSGSSPFLKQPYSALAHSVAYTLHYPCPATVIVDPVPALCGKLAMDTTRPMMSVFLSDSDKDIRDKINKVAFSGGKDNVEEHRRLGGNCDVDVSFQYLRYFMEDEHRLEEIKGLYSRGEMLTGELKKEVIDMLIRLIGNVRRKRELVTEETIKSFMEYRSIKFADGSTSPTGVVYDVFVVEEEQESPDEECIPDEVPPKDAQEPNEDVVTPWEVIGNVDTGIDYDKLIERYGSSKITDDLVDRFEAVTGKKAHHLLRRGMFYAHREFNEILDAFEKGQKFFLYTGRGPSSEALHLGHLIPFMFTKWLQEIFDVPLVVQLTDDEKCLMRNINIDEVQRLAIENAKDIIAVGFDVNKTFIFRDLEYLGQEPAFYQTVFRVGSKVTFNQVKGIFGFTKKDSVEKIVFPATQAAPSFSSSFPAIFRGNSRLRSLIPCAIDQDPYFRMTRDVAPRLDMPKPALILSRFFPSLQGNQTKMNASDPNSAIFMTDSAATIVDKIMKHAFTLSAERRAGLTPDQVCQRDVCYQYLTFFVEDDDRLEEIRRALVAGTLSDAQLKTELVDVLTPIVVGHAAARSLVSEDVVRSFMTPRSLNF